MNAKEVRISDIRNGLTQYLGAMMQNTKYSPEENRHLVVAALSEEIMKLVIENGKVNSFASKPFFRAINILSDTMLKEWQDGLTEFPDMGDKIKPMIHSLKEAKKVFVVEKGEA